MPPDDVIIYCDESGNSGPNYVDPNQPFFALASWCMPYAQLGEIAAVVETHRQTYSGRAPELKASNILRSQRGKEGAVSLLSTLGKLGCVPVFVIAEKRYCVAGKIVETFLDPAFNPLVNNWFIPDTTTKQEIANTLYDRLPESVLNNFAAAYRDPTREVLQYSLDEIVASVRSSINPELADLIQGSGPKIGEIADVERAAALLGNVQATLNLPALASLLMMIELLARNGCIAPRKFVHDEIRTYQEGYQKMFGIMRSAGEGAFEFPNGSMALYPLRNIPIFELAKSHVTPMIQAADVLAGATTHLARLAMSGSGIAGIDVELAELIFPALLSSDLRIGWSIGSDTWVRALGRSYFGRMVPSSETDHNGIQTSSQVIAPAPLLPALRDAAASDSDPPRFRFDLPIYGLVGKTSGDLMSIKDEPPYDIPGGSAVLLFTKPSHAHSFLSLWKEDASLTEEMVVIAFGPREVHDLVPLLERASMITGTLAVDPGQETMCYVQLPQFVGGLRVSLDRIKRAVTSGIIGTIFRREEIGGSEVLSMLASDGTYVAMRGPGGQPYRGRTREEAVQALLDSEKDGSQPG